LDTSHLDGEFQRVGSEAEKGLEPATDALDDVQQGFKDAAKEGNKAADEMVDAGRRSSASMREARGEAALLGEEFGIHLPRHVRSFIADLPGVGEALSAAFAATAVIFVVQALDQATKKLADWIYKVKDNTEANKEWNRTIGDADAKMKAAAHSLDDYGKSADDLARENITNLVNAMNQHNEAAQQARFELSYLTAGTAQYNEAQRVFVTETKLAAAATDEHALAVKRLLDQEKDEARDKALANLKTEIELRKQLANAMVDFQQVVNGVDKENADEEKYQISLKALQALAVAEQKYGKDSVDEVRKINAQIETLQAEHALKMAEELKKQTTELDKNLAEMQKLVVERGGVDVVLPKNVQQLLQFRAAAKELGITLDTDLNAKMALAKKTLQEYTDAGGKDVYVINSLKEALAKLERQYADFPSQEKYLKNQLAEAKANHQSTVEIEKNIVALIKQEKALGVAPGIIGKTNTAMDELKKTTGDAATEMGTAFSQAFTAMLRGTESFGEAMEKATFKMLGSMAQQWATYYLALAVGNAFTDPAAAAEELAAAVALEALAGTLNAMGSGGGGASGTAGTAYGSGKNNYQYGSSVSDTTSLASSGRSAVGVQGFAEGGLVSQPTLAMIGEGGGREAALPLDNPDAMDAIGKAVSDAMAAHGGGGTHFHVNVNGMISDDNLTKVMKKMSDKVTRKGGTLQASHSFKITKRGG
jgi:hypothetical protein